MIACAQALRSYDVADTVQSSFFMRLINCASSPLILLAILAESTWQLLTTINLVSSAIISGFERRL
jgi:hypothetical protein